MRRIAEQIPKGATQQGRIKKDPTWGSPDFDYSIPQASYLDRVPWTLNETTCDPSWAFAHGRSCIHLIQTFAKSEGQNLSHRQVLSGGAEYASTSPIHDYSPQGNVCQYKHQDQKFHSLYGTGWRGRSAWTWGANSANHEPPRGNFEEADSVWAWKATGSTLPSGGKHPKIVPSRPVQWLASGEDFYRGQRNEFTFHAYASWQGKGSSSPDSVLFAMSKGLDNIYDVALNVGQSSNGYITVKLATDYSGYYDDDEEIEDYMAQSHVVSTDNLADLKFHLITVVFENSSLKVYCDGEKLGWSSGGTQYGNLLAKDSYGNERSTNTCWLGSRTDSSTGGWLGALAWGGLWGFAWPEQSIRLLAEDVYAPFRLRERSSVSVASPQSATAEIATATASGLDASAVGSGTATQSAEIATAAASGLELEASAGSAVVSAEIATATASGIDQIGILSGVTPIDHYVHDKATTAFVVEDDVIIKAKEAS